MIAATDYYECDKYALFIYLSIYLFRSLCIALYNYNEHLFTIFIFSNRLS